MRVFKYLVHFIFALSLGMAFAFTLSSYRLGPHWQEKGQWHFNTAFGTSQATLLERAYAARHALFVLPSSETYYLFAETDDLGAPLLGSCFYKIQGQSLDVRYWSLAAYNEDGRLTERPSTTYSLSNLTSKVDSHGFYEISLMKEKKQNVNWLPIGNQSGILLVLRVYLRADQKNFDFSETTLPSIHKEGCNA